MTVRRPRSVIPCCMGVAVYGRHRCTCGITKAERESAAVRLLGELLQSGWLKHSIDCAGDCTCGLDDWQGRAASTITRPLEAAP
jgi:hypothetical protein